jgi:S1-C subfamily serine protease
VSFLNAGVPALHLFSGLHGDYHRVSDTADEIDYAGLSDVAAWSEEALRYLGGNEGPLRVTLANAAVVVAPQGTGARRVSLGTLPDFGYEGEGVRVSGVTPNSAAALAGIQEGDILLSFAGAALSDLQTYSNLLRAAAVGDSVVIEVLRAAERLEMTAVLTARE